MLTKDERIIGAASRLGCLVIDEREFYRVVEINRRLQKELDEVYRDRAGEAMAWMNDQVLIKQLCTDLSRCEREIERLTPEATQ